MKLEDALNKIEEGKNAGPLGKLTGNYDVKELQPSLCKFICPECEETIVSMESTYTRGQVNMKERYKRSTMMLVAFITMAMHKVTEHGIPVELDPKDLNKRFIVKINEDSAWIHGAQTVAKMTEYVLTPDNCEDFARSCLIQED